MESHRHFDSEGPKRQAPGHPNAWLWEPLESSSLFELKSMFGGKSVYWGGKLMLYFTSPKRKDDDWDGICVATSQLHHASLMETFPELSPHPVIHKWLYLRQEDECFETVAGLLVEAILRGDPRIGVVPPPRRSRKQASRKTRQSPPSSGST